MTRYVTSQNLREVTDYLLNGLLELTGSEYGFAGEILHRNDGSPYLKTHSILDISRNRETSEFYQANSPTGLEFSNLDTLYGSVMRTGQTVLSNEPCQDPRSGGVPQGHPPLNSFLGIPVFYGSRLIGMYGLANRADGYDQQLADFLIPFNTTYGVIIHAARMSDAERQFQPSLRESEERLKEAQRIGHIGDWSLDVNSGSMTWSDEVFRIYGQQPGQFSPTYQSFLNRIHPHDRERVEQLERKAFATGEQTSLDHRIILPDDSVRWVHKDIVTVPDEQGDPLRMMGTVQDITQRKLAEEALVKAKEEAESASRAKSQFLSSMSHELRTPMNAILGFGQLLETESLNAEQHEFVEEILNAGQHLLELINEVLDLAKIEQGRIDLSLESVGLQSILDECLMLIQPLAQARHIKLQLDHNALENVIVRTDATRLKQVIVNLLSNAVKYNYNHGHVHIALSNVANDMARLCIADSGPGIAEEYQSVLFTPFSRLGADSSSIEGSGIGLALSKNLIELMGGGIGFESQAGAGSRFWVDVPLDAHTGQTSTQEPSRTTPGEQQHASGHHTILYIEDHPANLRLVAQVLSRRNDIHLITAHDPVLGLELAFNRGPDLILLDINLPGMDGYQVLERLRAMGKTQHIPVIAVSANAMPSDIEKGQAAGFSDYIVKPLNVPDLLRAVDSALRALAEPGGPS
jgi:PAS domain S-box-containing protein